MIWTCEENASRKNSKESASMDSSWETKKVKTEKNMDSGYKWSYGGEGVGELDWTDRENWKQIKQN